MMLLKNKNAIIYGAGGSLGSAVAKAFAQEGARVFLTGPSIQSLEKVAGEIRDTGGKADIDLVNALDEQSIKNHVEKVIHSKHSIDISFNAVGLEDVQDIPLIDMELNDFIRPITRAMQTQFLTAKIVGSIMKTQRSGVILSITATPGGMSYPNVGGFGPACNAIEGFSKNLAAELGQSGVRVITIRSAGSPDSRPFQEALDQNKEMADIFIRKLAEDTMLNRLPSVKDIANIAAFLASTHAAAITGVTIDATSGTTSGLNASKIPIAFI